MNNPVAAIECRGVTRIYNEGAGKLKIFDGIDLRVEAGETLAIVGSSGAGKTTLLNILGGLDKPTQGEVWACGQHLTAMNDELRTRFRNRSLGFVYQFHHLLPEFTALENVAMPCLLAGKKVKDARLLAGNILDQVGLSGRLTHKPAELSGGERQRVAIARALVNTPPCVLMDEPTGNLDEGTAAQVQALIERLSKSLSTAFVVVTHDLALAGRLGRVLRLEQGRLVGG